MLKAVKHTAAQGDMMQDTLESFIPKIPKKGFFYKPRKVMLF